MRYSHIKTSVLSQFSAPQGNKVVPFILGAPGGGKSACARDIVKSMGIDNVVEFTASLRDPVDVLGVPDNTGEYTRWVPPQEFYQLRRGVGAAALILEELSDAPIPMQNALCRVIYDRYAGQLELTDQLFIIATGNRTEDKSGANRITSKLAGRTRRFDFTENVDDWTDWALDNGIKPMLIQFVRFRPALLSEFDPNRFANPTPRTWERVSLIPEDLPPELFFDNAKGEVGEGAASEYTAFRNVYFNLPDIDALLLDPGRAPVPSDPATLYALTGALASRANDKTIAPIMTYLKRLPPEFNVMTIKDAMKYFPGLTRDREFGEWAVKYSEVLM